MPHSPVGGLIEATPAAEEGESGVLLDLIGRWRVEILKSEIRITPVTGQAAYRDQLIPLFQLPARGERLREGKERGIISPSKAQGDWQLVPAQAASDWIFGHISFT